MENAGFSSNRHVSELREGQGGSGVRGNPLEVKTLREEAVAAPMSLGSDGLEERFLASDEDTGGWDSPGFSHEKKKTGSRILSMKYWLFIRDPYI